MDHCFNSLQARVSSWKSSWRETALFSLLFLLIACSHLPREHHRSCPEHLREIDWVVGKSDLNLPSIRSSFKEDGFVVVRGALPEQVVDELQRRFPRYNTWASAPLEWLVANSLRQFATLDGLWILDDLFWQVWTRSLIPSLLSNIMEVEGFKTSDIRLLTDYVVGIKAGGSGPEVIGKYHMDSTSFDVVDTAGFSVWIPLMDIDSSLGGSIFTIGRQNVNLGCLHSDRTYNESCILEFEATKSVASYARGDILLFSHDTVHKTQPLPKHVAQVPWRYALIGRFVAGETSRWKAPMLGPPQRKNSCKADGVTEISAGALLHSPCFPTIWPSTGAHAESSRAQGELRRDSRAVAFSKIIRGFLYTKDYY